MLKESPLGKKIEYVRTYSPHLLFPVSRSLARDKIPLKHALPFHGVDIWNGFELSWLNPKGKPEIAIAEFQFPCETPNVVESKSLKLYLNSFNQTHCGSIKEVEATIEKDLTEVIQGEIKVRLIPVSDFHQIKINDFTGICLDHLDIETDTYQVNANFLTTKDTYREETLYSHLLKSDCMATRQPDWGSILIRYKGEKIDHEGLLKYIISYRNHVGFAEHCVEQIYCDILKRCGPQSLTVYGRYTKRGGLDINPFRSNFEKHWFLGRQPRQ